MTHPAQVTAGRVLIVVENLPVPFDRRVWSEATALKRAGYAVSVICPRAPGYETPEEIIDGIYIYRHPLPFEARGAAGYLVEYPVALFWQFVLSLKIAQRHGFDVIHACNPPDLIFFVALLYKFLFGTQFLFDHHDANPELYEAKFHRRDVFWKFLVLMEKLTFKTADVSIATNDSYRNIAVTRGGMPPDRVFVVRSGPNLDRVRSVSPDLKWRNGRQFLVGYVGVIGQSEGLDLLLGSVDHIVRNRSRNDLQFVIVGSGPELQKIIQICRYRKLDEYITFTGRVDDTTLFTILSTADVCVNPDRVTPMNDISTMNKIMEYMALGKPIVQFDVTEGRYSAGDASLYAKPNDVVDFAEKILELIDHPQRRDAMGEFGLQRVRGTLAWEHEVPKLLSAYRTVFASSKKRSGIANRLVASLTRHSNEPPQ